MSLFPVYIRFGRISSRSIRSGFLLQACPVPIRRDRFSHHLSCTTMYSLYPYLITGFFWWVDRRNLSLAVFKALLADSDLSSRRPFSLMASSNSLRSDVPSRLLFSGIFFFPFSVGIARSSPCLSSTCQLAGHRNPTPHSACLAEMKSDSLLECRFLLLPISSWPHRPHPQQSVWSFQESKTVGNTKTLICQTRHLGSLAPIWC